MGQLIRVNDPTDGTVTQSIDYDDIGNPLTDGIWRYTWENGQQLKQM